ncbi:hypothetical protein FNF28_05860 [Cafeteria roenbergensis]|uniref:Uncharacterized protein n=1 Tax=Cafeteria roenbergensis TaxID=33653 RepID=A0A5A8D269_CAFRO|nr:hypothetical protein FNF28_05860 [Cafeteria roenbergensis]
MAHSVAPGEMPTEIDGEPVLLAAELSSKWRFYRNCTCSVASMVPMMFGIPACLLFVPIYSLCCGKARTEEAESWQLVLTPSTLHFKCKLYACGCCCQTTESKSIPLDKIQDLAPEVARATGQITAAHEHYIRACCPDRLFRVLVSWSSACKPSERGLLLVRACLQMLAMGNLRDPVRCLQALEARRVVPSESAALAAAEAGAARAAAPAEDSLDDPAGCDEGQVRCGGIVWKGARLSLLNLLRILFRVCACGKAAADVWAEVRARYSPLLDGEGAAGVDDGEIGRLVDISAARFLR